MSMTIPDARNERPNALGLVSSLYARCLVAMAAFLPAFGILYLRDAVDQTRLFEAHSVHEVVIAVATIEGLFVTWITYRYYRHSGEPILRWMTLAFMGFTITYLPHGILTRLTGTHQPLFLIFGPVSRLVMAILLVVATLAIDRPPDVPAERPGRRQWIAWAAFFVTIALAVGLCAVVAPDLTVTLMRDFETAAALIYLLGLAVLLTRRVRSPLVTTFYAVSTLYFAQSSCAFLLSVPWNHQWWFAHAVFAIGVFLISFGVVLAYLTAQVVSQVLGQRELMTHIVSANAASELALADLRKAHEAMQKLAATDPLTGAANRREFLARTEIEIARARRAHMPLSLIIIDLDHFKRVNDRNGHAVGDEVLKAFVTLASAQVRPGDLVGRLGGEEFAVLLPNSTGADAAAIADRLRARLAETPIRGDGFALHVTASMGVAQWGIDGDTQARWFAVADGRLYKAKGSGRNKVESEAEITEPGAPAMPR